MTLAYNGTGQVILIDGPRTDVSDVTSLAYNNCATGGGCGQLSAVTNALGQVTTFDSYDPNGRLLQKTDPNGLVTSYLYDPRGRVTQVTQSPPGGPARVTQYAYNAGGDVTLATFPDGRTLTYTYDAARLLTRVTDNLGNYVAYGYDARGNRTQEHTHDASAALVRSIDRAYDLRNRVSQINAAGSLTQLLNDAVGNLVSEIDPNNNPATAHSYDALNRLTQTVDALSGVSGYGYDVNDRIKQVAAPNNATTQYAYDDLGNLVQEVSPDRGTLTYTHDAAGNVMSSTDARAITASHAYDALNRVTAIDYPGTSEDVTFTYDAGPGCSFGVGRLCQVVDESGTTQYGYDAFGNVIEQVRTELGIAYTTAYSYDAGDRVTSMTYPDGRVVSYARDALGRVSAVTLTSGGNPVTITSNAIYRADGVLTGQSFGNGLTETRQYDLQGRLTSQALGALLSVGYSYDANGNVLIREARSYQYDALDRLSQESDGTPIGYGYDPNGNRLTKTQGAQTTSYAYHPGTNQLASIDTTALAYDAAGNLITDEQARILTYNNTGRLAEVQQGVNTLAAYSYNVQGQRTRKVTASGTVVYHYDLTGHLLAETTHTGVPLRDYVWQDATPVAQIDAAGGLLYLHTDHLQTPRLATNAAGTAVWRWEGEAFGATLPNEDPDQDQVLTTVNLRLPGQYFDAETELSYNWNRYYDPKLGRYITSDPIGLAGGLNTYPYVFNNPLRWIDPLGLFCIPFPDETTDWETYWRGNPSYQLGEPVVAVNGIGFCRWTRIIPTRQKRMVRSRQLCWECASECRGGGCSFEIKYGPWRREDRPSDERDSRLTRVIAWLSDGRDPGRPDVGFCNNPWTGERAIIDFRGP